MNELEWYFCFEFINCLDEVVVFYKLIEGDLKYIIDFEIVKVDEWLVECGLKFELIVEVKELLLEKGIDEKFGV